MRRSAQAGFTLLELIAVIGIIAILAGIVSTVASGAMRSAREKRTQALRMTVEQAIAAYYAQEGQWPRVIENKAANLEEDSYEFSSAEANEIMREVVGKAFGRSGGRKSVLIDASGLFVCQETKAGHANSRGLDFSEAAAIGAKRNVPLSQMAFGYPDAKTGAFRHFWFTYNSRTDAVSVTLKAQKHSGY